MQPTLRQFTYLLALKREKSFSRAAESCHVTQSTLSAGIKELELALGQTLIDRHHRQCTMTPLGEEVAEEAQKILQKVDGIVQRARKLAEPLCGPLRIGVIPTIAPYMLPGILPGLQKHYPLLELQLQEDLSAHLAERLHNGSLDAALMAFPYDLDGLDHIILFEEPFLLAAPKSRTIANKNRLSIADLDADDLLLLEDGHCLRDQALAACKLQLSKSKRGFRATSLPTLIQMVQHGYGSTLLPLMATKGDLIPDNIQIIAFRDPQPMRQIGLCWHKSSPRAEEFRLLSQTISDLAISDLAKS